MLVPFVQLLVLSAILSAVQTASFGQTAPALRRFPNSSLKMPSTPPALGFQTIPAFGNVTFKFPMAISAPPGETNRLFVAEKAGRIMVITNLANPTSSVFLNLTNRTYFNDEGGILGLAFHPGFATNRYFYVNYTLKTNTPDGVGVHDRISRFEASADDPNQASGETEVPLTTQFRVGSEHHGGDIHFGPDGYLYASLGDASGSDDTLNKGQVIDRGLFAGIIRIDVDKRPGNLAPNSHSASSTNYAIPFDNPFVGATNFNSLSVDPLKICTEFWAKGLRNPWRMSFDSVTGLLYCGDVGQATYEEINIIEKGGNYGWPIREGTIAGPQFGSPLAGKNFRAIDPILEYMHGSADALQASAVMGGVVYNGQSYSELNGNYIFSDHVNGNIWAFRYDGKTANNWRRLTTLPGISAFGIDPSNGDVLMAFFYGASISRLVYNGTSSGQPLPPALVNTGVFTNLTTLTPNTGIVPYEINVPFWSDHASKKRWFSIPNTNLVIGISNNGQWQFPIGSVWIKHFELELTNGVPESSRRLETRLLVRNSQGVYGVTYRWDNSQTNAILVGENGLDESFDIHDGGIVRTQIWHYPSRTECLICHNSTAGWVLGFKGKQINRDSEFGQQWAPGNQIAALVKAGYFSTKNIPNPIAIPALANARDLSASVEYRVRSYLDANCSQCHQPDGLGQSVFDTRIETPTSLAGLVNGIPTSNGGNSENRIIKPGSIEQSALLSQISSAGSKRMPPLASNELDMEDINLVREWIMTGLTNYQSFSEWQNRFFGSTNSPQAQAMTDYDSDGASNYLEFLTGTDPLHRNSYWQVNASRMGQTIQIQFEHLANRGFQVQFTTNLSAAASWQPLDAPGNELTFPASGFEATFEDSITNASGKFFRVEVMEP
jgi:uncharacterized repeat protein (TIGR03806 family)